MSKKGNGPYKLQNNLRWQTIDSSKWIPHNMPPCLLTPSLWSLVQRAVPWLWAAHQQLQLCLLVLQTSSSSDISPCSSNPNEWTFYCVSQLWSHMGLLQSIPMENTLLSFIKTFLCPELSSWFHQTPAEKPPVFLASRHVLKGWHCLSRASAVNSMNNCQQVWR